MRISNLYEGAITTKVLRQAIEYLLSNIDWSGGDGEGIIHHYVRENDIDEGDIPKNLTDKRSFKKWLKEWAANRIDDALFEIENHYRGAFNLMVYRMIVAPQTWNPYAQSLGIFWSWQEDTAEAHWGSFNHGMNKYLITGEVDRNHVDWASTLAANANPSTGIEKEITLLHGSPVKIVQIRQATINVYNIRDFTEMPNVEGIVVPA